MTGKGIITGRHVLYWLGGFFGVMLLVNAIFVYAAVTSFTGEDAPRAYAQGLAFNETLSARARQADLGWRVVMDDPQTEENAVHIVLHVTDAGGAAVRGLAGRVLLRRPTAAALDREGVLSARLEGGYVAAFDEVQRGQWDLILLLSRGEGAPFEARKRLWIK